VSFVRSGAFAGIGDVIEITVGDGTLRPGSFINFAGILWRVLEIEDGKALVITEDILFASTYHSYATEITWEHSDLRRYLNNEFFESAFTPEEQARISETLVVNNANARWQTPGGNNTLDRVFLLNINEVNRYFRNDPAKVAYTADGTGSFWWLRSPGMAQISAARVRPDGSVLGYGSAVSYDKAGVRPVIWLTLE
jgi:hypothetical protein